MAKKKKKKKFKYKNHEKKAQQQSQARKQAPAEIEESVNLVSSEVQAEENQKEPTLSYAEKKAKKAASHKSDRNNKTPFIVFGIVILLVILGLIFLGGKEDRGSEREDDRQEEITDEDVAEYIAEIGVKELVVVSEFKNTVRDGKQTGAARIPLKRTGEIETAQIHVLASSDGLALDQYSTAYVKLMTVDVPRGIGGHLHQDDSVITSDATDQSLFVYEMNSVPFRPLGSSPELATANWLDTINTYEDFKIYAFTSTIGEGEIEEIMISYTCAEGTDCAIEILE